MRNLFLAALVLIATSAKAVPPMPPELARTTWRWVSLTTPEENADDRGARALHPVLLGWRPHTQSAWPSFRRDGFPARRHGVETAQSVRAAFRPELLGCGCMPLL
jgi:hypothetical protein